LYQFVGSPNPSWVGFGVYNMGQKAAIKIRITSTKIPILDFWEKVRLSFKKVLVFMKIGLPKVIV